MPAIPTANQLRWAEAEIGVIIHLDVQVFEPGYRWREQRGYTPPAACFDPRQLDTDQWIASAKAAGATYAVLVAKHCSGFSLWPTAAHPYSVAASPWRGGKGDIVGDFVASCRRAGVLPGLYCSASANAYLQVDNPGRVLSGDQAEQRRYNAIVEQQLRELWTGYGELFELWFDGGVLPVEEGGPDVVPLLERHQPQAVVFQGPRRHPGLLRWVGNEHGAAPDPCWSATGIISQDGGDRIRLDLGGDPDGAVWAPAEADMPLRDAKRSFQGGWFWKRGEDATVWSEEHLEACYDSSVGRNANLLLGLVVDDRGLVPDADRAALAGLGRRLRRRSARTLAGAAAGGARVEAVLPRPALVDEVVVMEDLTRGERVRSWRLLGRTAEGWQPLSAGTGLGHKRIVRLPPRCLSAVALEVAEARPGPAALRVEVRGE